MHIRPADSSADVNQLVRANRAVFEPEYGLSPEFVAEISLQLAELRRSGWPGSREGLWLAELDGRVVGGVTLRDEGGDLARLGHLALEASARGSGAGRRLVQTVVDTARAAGYKRIELSTFSALEAAREIYRRAGFELKTSERMVRWGRELDWERWELSL